MTLRRKQQGIRNEWSLYSSATMKYQATAASFRWNMSGAF
ncbi:hypothetical protein WQQ_13530 [Hydrocarboniphaga effusa AP103]|uniref:Uncharacterized protein n=1 Tax=Hydrocarboniphaga effusa AP103 TaxID=1172194 RepID=I8I4M5_9GAMM|nr:hypothetical protein WQQ_13530 [Hydrocarboniphaga effusa AP103]